MKRALPVLTLVCSLSVAAFASRTVHDELGREVRVPDHPHRLVCLAPSITETVFKLGRGDDVVGITDFTKFPPEALKKPSVGGVIDPSLEKLVSLKPDLVLAMGDLNNTDLIRAIDKLGFPVFAVDPHGLHDIYRAIADIGKAIDADREASDLVASLQAREAVVRQRVSAKSKPRLFFLLWPDPITTAGRRAFVTDLIEAAGGVSVTADLPNEWPHLSLEAVLADQPEYLLLVRGGEVNLAELRHQGNWMKLQAVRDGKVYYVDEGIQFPSPAALNALEDLASQLHPVEAQKK
jgi:iron complex transport system substrate-binding protein